jgi:hypothetical protein
MAVHQHALSRRWILEIIKLKLPTLKVHGCMQHCCEVTSAPLTKLLPPRVAATRLMTHAAADWTAAVVGPPARCDWLPVRLYGLVPKILGLCVGAAAVHTGMSKHADSSVHIRKILHDTDICSDSGLEWTDILHEASHTWLPEGARKQPGRQ